LTENYRGHRIRITCTRLWDAVLVEADTGVVLPTKATAQLHEGCAVVVARARELIDLYLEVRGAVVRPGNTPSLVMAGRAEYPGIPRRASS
jgi:hypothetical protein